MRITASHIVEWANTQTKNAQMYLPRLIRRLSFLDQATKQLAFPAGDSTFVPGWDGILSSEVGNAWVPAGESRWEIGCDQNPTTKANKDYVKRLQNTAPNQRASLTFVFVTPRRWTTKAKWIAAKRRGGEWADVRAYDADDLEQWLEHAPTVGLEFAEEIGLAGFGVESTKRFWDTWAGQCKPVITSEAFFTDRLATREKLFSKIRDALSRQDTASPLVVSGDSEEEATAFVAAALLASSDLADKALVVTQPAGWQFIERNSQLQIAIASRTDVAQNPTTRAGLLLVIPCSIGNSIPLQCGAEVILDRASIYEFEKALVLIGIEESDANRYALSTGRSWAVLRRQLAINPAIRKPSWLATPQASGLATLCLLGVWQSDNAADRRVVAKVADQSYEVVERDLRHLAQLDDAPIMAIGTVWRAKSPLELLELFGSQITAAQLDRFFLIAAEILSAPDPQLELPAEDRFAAQMYQKARPNSTQLLKSVCDALVKLTVRGSEQKALMSLKIVDRVDSLIHKLLSGADAERWLSLAAHLPALAEAAPGPFLTAVENSLRASDAAVSRLLTESDSTGFSGRCWHSGLLWALEILAWSPARLARVALILAQLTHYPLKGNWGNRPDASLYGLFRTWLPQTAASVEDRIKVLHLLIEKDTDVAYRVLLSLTSQTPQTAIPAACPVWRDDNAGAGRSVTYAERNKMRDEALKSLFVVSQGSAPRIAELIRLISPTDAGTTSKVFALTAPFSQSIAVDDDREALRSALREKLHWHHNYDQTDTSVLTPWLKQVDSLYIQLAPLSQVLGNRWLFDNNWADLPVKSVDFGTLARCDNLQEYRIKAVNGIYDALGMAGLEELITTCGNANEVGAMLARVSWSPPSWPEWLVAKGLEFTHDLPMTWCISAFLHTVTPTRCEELLGAVLAIGDRLDWVAQKRARFLCLAPSIRPTWEIAKSSGSETETAYWMAARPSYRSTGAVEDLEFMLHKLEDAGRPRTALHSCNFLLEQIETEVVAPEKLLLSILQRYARGDEPDGPSLSPWNLAKLLARLKKSTEIERTALVLLEFALFPALGFGHEASAATLYEELMSKPQVFADLIQLAYKPENSGHEEVISESKQTAATNAWRVLRACHRPPGLDENGQHDSAIFVQFIGDARELCRRADTLADCDVTLGQILANVSPAIDGSWPPLHVLKVLDPPDMEHVREGFYIGTQNNRGVTTRQSCEGGGQERNLAAYYRGQAERVQLSFPNVASLLENLSKAYERDGAWEDTSANLRKENY